MNETEILNNIGGEGLLSANFLLNKDFWICDHQPFQNLQMPHYVKNGVILLFNTPVTKFNENNFLIGYAEMRNGEYYAVTFRWIKEQKELIEIYKAITGENL